MKASALKYSVLTYISGAIAVILILIPFHAFLTVWLASNFGHYTAFRLWKEILLALTAFGTLYLLLFDEKIRSHTLTRRLVWLILLYCILQTAWGLSGYLQGNVTPKALGYGLIANMRYVVFFLVTWSAALRTSRLHKSWQQRVLLPATIVIIFGLLQILVLPNDFLRHFGYGPTTILPYETINHNQHYIRIMSTLRGANPLGAYLIIPLSLWAILIGQGKRRWQELGLFFGGLIVLFFSFSRSAWIGMFLSLAFLAFVSHRKKVLQPKVLTLLTVGILVLAGLGLMARGSARLQNVFLHTQNHSAVKTTSNTGHLVALKNGLRDIAHHPLGHGVGTSGPASVYNTTTKIPENYFLQIGEETGWLGLGLFILINAGVAYLLWVRRAEPLALALLSSLIGLTFVNLLSHAWSDDTLAYLWWGLAGIAMVRPKIDVKNHK